jgi:DUF1680 family protein
LPSIKKFEIMKKYPCLPAFCILLAMSLFSSCTYNSDKKNDYPISPVQFTDVKLMDNFWLPRIITNTEVTIPIAFRHCENTDRINNFAVAGGLVKGEHVGKRYNDSDVFKIMEGASFSLSESYDPSLDLYLDSLIVLIGLAQEEDGYLYTARTINPDSVPEYSGTERWSFLEQSHELYNVGHMYEAAVAHFQATGKTSFLDIAIRNANLIDKEFGWGKIEKAPGHQEIEIGLVKLYRVTGDERYLKLARFFLDVRGKEGAEYNQSHKRVTEQTEPVGHAVRALYMYSGMADVAALTGDSAYIKAIDKIWENVVTRKIYVTGGIGQVGGNEGFGPDYELPNSSAYCETCASIANVLWNHRLFLLHGDSKYMDVMERTMYNALLSGVSFSGDLFFYPNVLESDGNSRRQEWFGCACCPSNIARFLPSVPGYIYAQKNNTIYINLFISSEATIKTPNGEISIIQKSNYPWEGNLEIYVNSAKKTEQEIRIRIPGWVRGEAIYGDLYKFESSEQVKPALKLNNEVLDYKIEHGYAIVSRSWENGDRIILDFPMAVKQVIANDNVEEDRDKFAIQRGPVVFCLEGIDQEQEKGLNITVNSDTEFISELKDGLFNGVNIVRFNGIDVDNKTIRATAIPYYAWANRDTTEMKVWIPYNQMESPNQE